MKPPSAVGGRSSRPLANTTEVPVGTPLMMPPRVLRSLGSCAHSSSTEGESADSAPVPLATVQRWPGGCLLTVKEWLLPTGKLAGQPRRQQPGKKKAPSYGLDSIGALSVAERVGFEPTVVLPLRLFSSQVHSTTLPPLLCVEACDYSRLFLRSATSAACIEIQALPM